MDNPHVTSKYGDHEHPPIPDGYTHVAGGWNNGFILQDNKGNQFVWIPVGSLTANGALINIRNLNHDEDSLCGDDFSEKFGRRAYCGNAFRLGHYCENLDDAFKRQVESVKKYGGFYVCRYQISAECQVRSVKGKPPIVCPGYNNALSIAQHQDLWTGEVTSHLLYGSEYDTILEWFLATGKTRKDIEVDSSAFGYYGESQCRFNPPYTGSNEKWQVNGIYDLAGNTWEWTQETWGYGHPVLRGGSFYNYGGNHYPIAYRGYDYPTGYHYDISCRAALFIP
jgi:hypothetical protein